nr:MAG TPA: hypothetical protein [Caudoviricetes sp.]
MIWLRSGRGFRPWGSANLPTTPQRCWKSTGRTCPDGGTSEP